MHHIHISTPFLIFFGIFVASLVAIVFAFVRSIKQDRLAAERAVAAAAFEADFNRRFEAARAAGSRTGQTPSPADVAAFMPYSGLPPRPASTMTQQVMPAVAPVYAHDPLSGLATGMMLGSMMGGHSHHDTTTIINNDTPSYSSSSSSSSYDSGASYDSGGSSYSSDSGSSGGFDASF